MLITSQVFASYVCNGGHSGYADFCLTRIITSVSECPRWLPFSGLRQVMEFKIVQAFFRTTFALPTSFDFALYMGEASDAHILSLVDVEASTWSILLVTCFLNLGRVKLWQVGPAHLTEKVSTPRVSISSFDLECPPTTSLVRRPSRYILSIHRQVYLNPNPLTNPKPETNPKTNPCPYPSSWASKYHVALGRTRSWNVLDGTRNPTRSVKRVPVVH